MVGIHPMSVSHFALDTSTSSSSSLGDDPYSLRALAIQYSKHVKAIGECGIDLSRGSEHLELQKRWLIRQLDLAVLMQLPIYLHERDAFDCFVEIMTPVRCASVAGCVCTASTHMLQCGLLQYVPRLAKIVINCFTGTRQQLQTYISWGAYIGITGVICNESRGFELRKYLADIPCDRLVCAKSAPPYVDEPVLTVAPALARTVADHGFRCTVHDSLHNAKALSQAQRAGVLASCARSIGTGLWCWTCRNGPALGTGTPASHGGGTSE
jgi:Tat protein secretion system quality control protein TatD with DNase activity